MEYKNGDILKTNCHNIPLCYHLAICVIDENDIYVWHCTPSKENELGGNIIKEHISEFLLDRKVIKVYKDFDITDNQIYSYAIKNQNKKWDAIQYNCETFVNSVLKNKDNTTQLSRAIVSATFLVGTFLIIKNLIN